MISNDFRFYNIFGDHNQSLFHLLPVSEAASKVALLKTIGERLMKRNCGSHDVLSVCPCVCSIFSQNPWEVNVCCLVHCVGVAVAMILQVSQRFQKSTCADPWSHRADGNQINGFRVAMGCPIRSPDLFPSPIGESGWNSSSQAPGGGFGRQFEGWNPNELLYRYLYSIAYYSQMVYCILMYIVYICSMLWFQPKLQLV